jgi:hypothetical protein
LMGWRPRDFDRVVPEVSNRLTKVSSEGIQPCPML